MVYQIRWAGSVSWLFLKTVQFFCVSLKGILFALGSLNHAHALFTCPAWAARVAREKASDNARAVAVIWEMHGFVNFL